MICKYIIDNIFKWAHFCGTQLNSFQYFHLIRIIKITTDCEVVPSILIQHLYFYLTGVSSWCNG